MSKNGKKMLAGKLLSKYLTEIAAEETELGKDLDGGDVMITKAEALARLIWKMALGYKEEVINKSGLLAKLNHRPDKPAMGIIFDRLEGRVAQSVAESPNKLSTADRVTEQAKKRINDI